MIESHAARRDLSSCLQRSGRVVLAQEDGDTRKGSRASAGKGSGYDMPSTASAQPRDGGVQGASPNSADSRAANGAGESNARPASGSKRRDPSVRSDADGEKGQQQARKKRRVRNRRRRNDASANNPDAASRQAHSKEDKPHGTAQSASVDGGVVSSQGPTRDKSETSGSDQSRNRKYPRRKSRRPDSRPQPEGSSSGQDDTRRDEGNGQPSSSKSGRGRRNTRGKSSEDVSRASHTDARSSQSSDRQNPLPQPARVAEKRSHAASNGSTYAALDLGTNNCRLLVAEPHGQSFRVVDAFSRIVRLGEGLSQSGSLSEEAQDRAISALKVCQAKLSARSVKRFRLIATEACRRAKNGAAFLSRVQKETGLKLEIVDRETEARLAVAGCASLVHPEADGVVLFDIGGGSSEIVWLDLDPLAEDAALPVGEKRNRQTRRALRHMSERIRCWTSLQVGVVTLSEKHGGKTVTRDHFETMVAEVREMLTAFEEREALTKAIKTKHIHMLGTSGTVTTLAGVHLGLERYDRRQVDGTWLTAAELRAMISRVLDMNFEERMNNPCIGQDRADLVLAGCAILEAFHREWPCTQLRVADRGLREGILMEMMIDDGVWNPQSHHEGQQNKKNQSRKRRSRRRGSRGHRGGQNNNQAQGRPQTS